MSKFWSGIKFKLTTFPLRPNFFLLLLIVLLAFWLLNPESAEQDMLQPIIAMLLKMGAWILIFVILLAFLSLCISYRIFFSRLKKGKAHFELNAKDNQQEQPGIYIRPTLSHTYRPLLGFISGRLIINNKELSVPFFLSSNIRKQFSFKSSGIYGEQVIHFPHIKVYEIEGTLLLFEDMLGLFRLHKKLPYHASIYNPPQASLQEEHSLAPLASADNKLRIRQMRQNPGELLHYKPFEYGDDIRRIVWKIYGKSRELIVRQEEKRNPYASRIEMYASFHCHFGLRTTDEALGNHLLNTYKNTVWSLFLSLRNNNPEADLVFIPENSPSASLQLEDNIARNIAQSEWQSHKPVSQFFNVQTGVVFCLHSMSNPKELDDFLSEGGKDKFIMMAYLSEAFNVPKTHWLQRIFMLPDEHNSSEALQERWLFSVARKQILKNEELLSNVLRKYGFV